MASTKANGHNNVTTKSLPQLKDLTTENITENVIKTSLQGNDPRMNFVIERLISHLHDFARETRLTTKEWRAGIDWIVNCGQITTEERQELITVSDVLGLSALVDSIDHPKPPGTTEGSILGPFHTLEAEHMSHGDHLSHDENGKPCLVLCTIRDTNGAPVPGAEIHIWEADSAGRYDVQLPDRSGPDGRCIIKSDNTGFWFKAIVPVPYPILTDGPVGILLAKTGRHPYRPAHMHFMIAKEKFDTLITAVYLRGSPYEDSDAVFGVKESLVIDVHDIDKATAEKYGVGLDWKLIKHDFVLASEEQANALRDESTKKALQSLGRPVVLANHAPATK